LNSEEIYIAFSFFFLTILGFVLSRTALLYVFVKSVNKKYMQQLSSYFYFLGHLELQSDIYGELLNAYSSLARISNLLNLVRVKIASFSLYLGILRFRYSLSVRLNFFFGLLCFFAERSQSRRFLAFKSQASGLFKFNFFE
jgi:hypothetical protein